MTTAYAFRQTEAAADRLALVAELFGPVTSAFLREHAPGETELAIDLGCGPGHTTELIADVVRPCRLVGLDTSPLFLELGGERLGNRAALLEHDVTDTPFPAREPTLLYCRFLLTHQTAPTALVQRWLGELAQSGRLLVEEVESMDTDEPVFRRYLGVVERMLTARGHRNDIGPELAAFRPAGARVVCSRVAETTPDPRFAARMFRANLAVWADDPVAAGEADELAAELDRRIETAGDPITWRMRQIVYETEAR
jgi:trans-aconitate 2-methyltransferase